MIYDEQDFLSLSGIQHFAFCRRQWALIHIEQQWSENLRTIEGQIVHEKAHSGYSSEKRKDVIISRGMPVFSRNLGINGVCDVVEFHRSLEGVKIFGREGLYRPSPVEYKRGKPKTGDYDALQLCAQTMCLEEMLLCEISVGYMYYAEINRRQEIYLSDALRDRVREITQEMHMLYEKRYTPKVKISKSCKACSLSNICIPKLNKNLSVSQYIINFIAEES
ncbi:MAG: CRISPR-associated protein Cas4 [Acetivibrionales bacterium]|jgi:CRISPR-associated exonuclease Cas4